MSALLLLVPDTSAAVSCCRRATAFNHDPLEAAGLRCNLAVALLLSAAGERVRHERLAEARSEAERGVLLAPDDTLCLATLGFIARVQEGTIQCPRSIGEFSDACLRFVPVPP